MEHKGLEDLVKITSNNQVSASEALERLRVKLNFDKLDNLKEVASRPEFKEALKKISANIKKAYAGFAQVKVDVPDKPDPKVLFVGDEIDINAVRGYLNKVAIASKPIELFEEWRDNHKELCYELDDPKIEILFIEKPERIYQRDHEKNRFGKFKRNGKVRRKR